MTAINDPLARVQAMVDAWRTAETFDTFDTNRSKVSPPNRQENCGFRHSRHFRHHKSEHPDRREQSADVYLQESFEQENRSRVAYSYGVESVESVEKARKDRKGSDLIFDTSSVPVSKNRRSVSKSGVRTYPNPASAGIRCSASVPAAWLEGVARLTAMPPPRSCPAHAWQQVIVDTKRFLHEWALQAAALGWPAWELFGCHRRAPWGRIDGMGLVLLLHGDPLAALTATEAVIRRASGAHQTWRRRQRDPLTAAERCLVWELA
jgi:hypothetical protein